MKRLLLTSAGAGPSENLARSLRAELPDAWIVGCHDNRFLLRKSTADRRYLIPPVTVVGYPECLRRVIDAERIDLAIPTSDADVRRFSELRRRLGSRTFLPDHAVVERCQDKYALTTFLRAHGVAVPQTHRVTTLDAIEELFHRLGRPPLAWCRIRTGSGAFGATPVQSPAQARSWIRWWSELRGVPVSAFTLSEYLPGRDFSCQALWQDGRLILVKTFENLAPFAAGSHPGGVSSVADLARSVYEPGVAAVCTSAIRALDPRASGVFCFDVRENAAGAPCVTEINAGRFSMSTNLYDAAGKHNMAAVYVRLALGEPVDIRNEYDAAEDYYMVRDLDTLPHVFPADQFFDGIEDARGEPRAREEPKCRESRRTRAKPGGRKSWSTVRGRARRTVLSGERSKP